MLVKQLVNAILQVSRV